MKLLYTSSVYRHTLRCGMEPVSAAQKAAAVILYWLAYCIFKIVKIKGSYVIG